MRGRLEDEPLTVFDSWEEWTTLRLQGRLRRGEQHQGQQPNRRMLSEPQTWHKRPPARLGPNARSVKSTDPAVHALDFG